MIGRDESHGQSSNFNESHTDEHHISGRSLCDTKVHPYILLTSHLESVPCPLDMDENTSVKSELGERMINESVVENLARNDTDVQTDVAQRARYHNLNKEGCINWRRRESVLCSCRAHNPIYKSRDQTLSFKIHRTDTASPPAVIASSSHEIEANTAGGGAEKDLDWKIPTEISTKVDYLLRSEDLAGTGGGAALFFAEFVLDVRAASLVRHTLRPNTVLTELLIRQHHACGKRTESPL